MNIISILQRYRKYILITLLLLIVIIVAFIVSTNGFIAITNRDGIKNIYYTSIDKSKSYERNTLDTTSMSLPSGLYIIESEFTNGTVTLQQVKVPGFLQKVTVTTDSKTYTSTTLSSNAGLFAGPIKPSGVETFDYSGGVAFSNFNTATNDTTNLNIPRFDEFVYLTESLGVGYIQSLSVVTPFVYDFTTNKVTYLDSITLRSATTPVKITRIDDDQFALYTSEKGLAEYSLSNIVRTVKFDNQKPALFNEKPLLDATVNVIALISGQDTLLSSDGEEAPDSNGDFQLKLYSTEGKVRQSFTITDELIRQIALSANSSYTAISESSSLEIINNSTGKADLTIPQPVENIKWLNDTSFTFTTTRDQQVFVGDIKNGVRSVYPKNTLNVSAFSYVRDNTIIFSALPDNNGIKTNPNLYKISLNSSVPKNTLGALPRQGEDFYIYELNNIIHVQLTRYVGLAGTSVSEQSRGNAYSYLKSNNIPQNNIIEEYIDIDVR